MISNERQHRAALRQRALLTDELDSLTPVIGSDDVSAADVPLPRRLMRASLEGQIADLNSEIGEYEALRSGATARIRARSLAEIPNALIKARIAAGLTQRELAERLGMKEQQIQRYESDEFASASISRLGAVMDALGVKLEAGVQLPPAGNPLAQLRRSLARLGFDRAVVERRFLRGIGDTPSQTSVFAVADRLARVLRVPVGDLLSGMPATTEFAAAVRFKAPANASDERLFAYAQYAEGIAQIVLRATAHLGPQHPVGTARDFRAGMNEQLRTMGVDTVVTPNSNQLLLAAIRHLHSLHIPVIALRDPGAFHGACFNIEGRVAIVLKSQGDSSSKWVNDLIHESRHGDDIRTSDSRTRIEFGEIGEWSEDPEEVLANDFAADVLFEGRASPVLGMVLNAVGGSVPKLKGALPNLAAQAEVPVDVLANYLAYQLSSQGINWWATALTFQTSDGPWRAAVDELLPLLQFADVDPPDRAVLVDALAN